MAYAPEDPTSAGYGSVGSPDVSTKGLSDALGNPTTATGGGPSGGGIPGSKDTALDVFKQFMISAGFDEETITRLMNNDANGKAGISTLVSQGWKGDQLLGLLSENQVWKERFAGNEERKKNNMQPLSYGEYLGLEKEYQQRMQTAGLPKDFYSGWQSYTNLIGGGTSPQEMDHRIDLAGQFVSGLDPQAKAALQQYYGIDDQHLVAHFLDPDQAQGLLDKQAQAAQTGAIAARTGLGLTAQEAEQINAQNYSTYTMHSAFGQIQQDSLAMQKLAALGGTTWSNSEAVDSAFNLDGGAQALAKQKSLASQERARFSGSSGLGNAGIGSQTAGQF